DSKNSLQFDLTVEPHRHSAFTDVDQVHGNSLSRSGLEFYREVNRIPEIAAVLALHSGERKIEKGAQPFLFNRLAQNIVRSQRTGTLYAGSAVHHRKNSCGLVGRAIPDFTERFATAGDVIAINDQAIQVTRITKIHGASRFPPQLQVNAQVGKHSPHNRE